MRGERGAAAVEFAVVLPFLALLLFGLIEFSRLMGTISNVRAASREAARYGSAVGQSVNSVPRYTDCNEIRKAARNWATAVRIADADITVTYDTGPGGSFITSCPVGGPSISPSLVGPGDRIVVTVAVPFDAVVPFIKDFTVTATDRRTIFKP